MVNVGSLLKVGMEKDATVTWYDILYALQTAHQRWSSFLLPRATSTSRGVHNQIHFPISGLHTLPSFVSKLSPDISLERRSALTSLKIPIEGTPLINADHCDIENCDYDSGQAPAFMTYQKHKYASTNGGEQIELDGVESTKVAKLRSITAVFVPLTSKYSAKCIDDVVDSSYTYYYRGPH